MACRKCGNCCRYINLHGSWFNNDMDYLESRGGTMHEGIAFFLLPCKHLLPNGLCDRYDNRPKWCLEIDDNPTHLSFFGCTYFEDK